MNDNSVLIIDPRIQFGRPCIHGTRVTAEAVAGAVAGGDSVDEVAADYDVTREQVLVACWWYVTAGVTGVSRQSREVRFWWGDENWGGKGWAYHAALILGGHRDHPGPLPDPPELPKAR